MTVIRFSPWGLPNSDGIYLVDAADGDLTIRQSRIVGTLVVTNLPPGNKVVVRESVNWEPAYPGYPALLVDGGVMIELWDGDLDESTLPAFRNLNPLGTPFQGSWDFWSQDDTYPSSIAGLIYCTGNLTFDGNYADNAPDIRGVVLVGGTCTLENQVHPTIEYKATFALSPPPGFGEAAVETGPAELKAHLLSTGNPDDIHANRKWGQYFKPNLPANAISWRVTSVDIWVSRERSDSGNLDVGLYETDVSNLPDSQFDSASLQPTALSWVFDWHNVPFAGHAGLNPDQGICLTLTSTQPIAPARLEYQPSGVSEPDTALITGDSGGWNTYETNKALGYRIHGIYTTPDGQVHITTGSWRQTAVDL